MFLTNVDFNIGHAEFI